MDCWGDPGTGEYSPGPTIIPCDPSIPTDPNAAGACPPDFPNCTCPSSTNGKRLTQVSNVFKQRVTGYPIFKATQLVFWCWNSARITKIYRVLRQWINPFPDLISLLWSYEGVSQNSCESSHCQEQAGSAQQPVTIVTISAKLHFRECLAWGIGICQNKYPGVWLRIVRGGLREGGIY
jgi:hypothetical protein